VAPSAGDPLIIDNARPLLAAGAWTPGDPPLMTCPANTSSGDSRTAGVADLVPLGADRVGILSREHATLVLCEAGRVTRSFGGRGQGPGQFEEVLGAMVGPGDSLVVLSPWKAVLFDPADGGFRELSRSQAGSDRHVSRLLETPEGLAGNRFTDGITRPEVQGQVDILLLDWSGRERGRIGPVPWATRSNVTTAQVLWGVGAPFVVGRDGYWFAVPDGLELRRYGVDGLERVVRAPTPPVLIAADLRARAVRRMREAWGWEAERVHGIDRTEVRGPGGVQAPAVLDMLLDDAGRLWARLPEARPGLDARIWRVFSPEGTWITDVDLPPGFDLHAVRAGLLYGVARTPEGGTEIVEVRRLAR
jgi:hypothetical protein